MTTPDVTDAMVQALIWELEMVTQEGFKPEYIWDISKHAIEAALAAAPGASLESPTPDGLAKHIKDVDAGVRGVEAVLRTHRAQINECRDRLDAALDELLNTQRTYGAILDRHDAALAELRNRFEIDHQLLLDHSHLPNGLAVTGYTPPEAAPEDIDAKHAADREATWRENMDDDIRAMQDREYERYVIAVAEVGEAGEDDAEISRLARTLCDDYWNVSGEGGDWTQLTQRGKESWEHVARLAKSRAACPVVPAVSGEGGKE